MRGVLSILFLLISFRLAALEQCLIADGLYTQTDVLLDSQLLYQHPEQFAECIETENGLYCDRNTDISHSRISTSFEGDGKSKSHSVSMYLWNDDKVKIANNDISSLEIEGIKEQLRAIRKSSRRSEIAAKKDLLFVAQCLLKESKKCKNGELDKTIRAFRLTGSDGRGNVQYTGYFVPVIMARKQKSSEFPYPIFKRPRAWRLDNGPHATREEIDKGGILDGQGLEIGWTDRPLAIFSMRMQGSGILQFGDGTQKLVAYDGQNGHDYVNLGPLLIEDGHLQSRSLTLDDVEAFFKENPLEVEKYLYQNPSFVFFKPTSGSPIGANGAKLTPGHSIAVDPKIIPLGGILLGKVPKLNDSYRVIDHELKLLFAQDTGAAIDGPGHVDLFMGIGPEAKIDARHLQHYGELWLLLPR